MNYFISICHDEDWWVLEELRRAIPNNVKYNISHAEGFRFLELDSETDINVLELCMPYIQNGYIERIELCDNNRHRIIYTNSELEKIIKAKISDAQNAISYLFPYVNSDNFDVLIDMCETLQCMNFEF